MVTWNPDLLNRYIAPGFAQFTAAVIPELASVGERAEHWMANHFLNNVFRAQFSGKQRQFAFNIIYRAQACFEHYEQARSLTLAFLGSRGSGGPGSGAYYRALRAWESCFLNFQVLVDLINRFTGTKVFEQDDGSPQQRAYVIANTIKHWAQNIARSEHHDDDTVPMWLSENGFVSREASLSYQELAALLGEAAVVAHDLMDPFARSERASSDARA
jgi:hypothetical protein